MDHPDVVAAMPMRQVEDLLAQRYVPVRTRRIAQRTRTHSGLRDIGIEIKRKEHSIYNMKFNSSFSLYSLWRYPSAPRHSVLGGTEASEIPQG